VILKATYFGFVMLTHAAWLAWSASENSPTWDEPGHLVAGIGHWRFGRFDLMRVNPPLVRLAGSLPLLFARADYDWSRYDGSVGARSERNIRKTFVELNRQRVFWLHTLARFGCIPFSLLGAWVCFAWARALYGAPAGMLAITLWCFSPNILAHAQLITPDVGAAALGAAAAYAFWRWLKRPGWPESLVAGLALGLAELTKTTWIVLFALWPLLWLAWRAPARGRPSVREGGRQTGQLAVLLALALYVLNLGYGFEGSFQRLGDYRFVSQALGGPRDNVYQFGAGSNRFADTWLEALPVPLPKNYVAGIDLQKWDFERKMWSYLRGEWRLGGWWYYYLYALAVKVPLGTWALVVLAAGVGLFARGYAAPWRDELMLLAPIAVVLTLVSSQTGFNHHLRYVLPIFPFAFIWTSKVARAVELRNRWVASLAGGALLWSMASSLYYYPHSLSYFNELAGGPKRGHEHLLDSNIDWGQDLLYLKRWLDEHPEARPLGLAYCLPFLDPSIAGIESTLPPPGPEGRTVRGRDPEQLGPKPGWYALSVREIRGRHGRYAYFLRFEPVAMAGYSIYIYHITLDGANRVRRELGLPELVCAASGTDRGRDDEQGGER